MRRASSCPKYLLLLDFYVAHICQDNEGADLLADLVLCSVAIFNTYVICSLRY